MSNSQYSEKDGRKLSRKMNVGLIRTLKLQRTISWPNVQQCSSCEEFFRLMAIHNAKRTEAAIDYRH